VSEDRGKKIIAEKKKGRCLKPSLPAAERRKGGEKSLLNQIEKEKKGRGQKKRKRRELNTKSITVAKGGREKGKGARRIIKKIARWG